MVRVCVVWAAVVVALCIVAGSVAAQTADERAILESIRDCVYGSETFESPASLQGGSLVDGIVGKALCTLKNAGPSFDLCTVPNPPAGTVTWWMRFNFDTNVGTPVFFVYNVGGWGAYANYSGNNGTSGMFWSQNAGSAFCSYPGGLTRDTWHFMAFSWNGDTATFFYDAMPNKVVTINPFSTTNFNSLKLANPYTKPGEGQNEYQYDEIRMYNRALTSAELKTYMEAVKAGGSRRDLAISLPASLARAERTIGLRGFFRVSDQSIRVTAELPKSTDLMLSTVITVTSSDGSEVARKTAAAKPGDMLRIAFPMKDGLPDGDYKIRCTVRGSSFTVSRDYTFNRTREEWEGNTIGVTDQVISPWTPMTVKPRYGMASCWGRTYAFGVLGMPAQVLSGQPEPTWGTETQRNLLASPVKLVVDTAGGELVWKGLPATVDLRSEARVDVRGVAVTAGKEVRAEVRGTLEYDGFYKFTIALTPMKGVSVNSVRLEVGISNDIAKLLNASGSGDMRYNKAFLDIAGKPDGEIWNSFNGGTNKTQNFMPHVWVGDDDRGIAFLADSANGWLIDDSKPCMDLVRRNGQTVLRLLLVNSPMTLKRPLLAQLSLQATPVKPRDPGGSWKKYHTYGWSYFDAAILYKDWDDPTKSTRAEDHPGFVDAEAQQQNRWWRYFCFRSDRIGADNPYYPTVERNGDEWLGDWGQGLHTPSQIDYLLWVYKGWHDKLGMKGIYYDNTFVNPAACWDTGKVWKDESGKAHAATCCFGDRDFMKRVRTYFLQQGPAPVLNVHMTDAPIIGTLGFTDFWMDGENGGYPDSTITNPDFVDRWLNDKGIPNLRITMGRMWGVMPIYLYTWGPEATYSVMGLFDIQHGLRTTLGGSPRNDIDLTAPDTRFLGFWNPDGRWQVVRGGSRIFVSAWTRPNPRRVRFQITNGGDAVADVDLQVDLAKLGFTGPVEVSDEVDGSVFVQDGSVIKNIHVDRHKNRCIVVAAPGVFETGTPSDVTALNTGTRIPELCDDFSTIGAAWEKSWNPSPTYGVSVNNATFDPYFGALRIHTQGGYANVARAINRDNISVRVRAYIPVGQQCGTPDMTHPMAALYWGKYRYIKCITTNPWGNVNGASTTQYFLVSTPTGTRIYPCPKPGRVTWMRWDLTAHTVLLYVSNDLVTWQLMSSVLRGSDFAGAPSHIILGTGCDIYGAQSDRLRNETPGIDDSYSFWDELITEQL